MFQYLRAKVFPKIIPQGSRILVAVSGGPDSVAMGHLLWRYSQEKTIDISLVFTHVNHGVRPESEEEAKQVTKMASELGIKCIVHKFNAKAYSIEQGKSFQVAAREWRYLTWKEDMEREGCNLLATAHHLGDQAETLLYRIIRGTGAAGLGGIYPKKGHIIRPLLSITKEQLIQYCRENMLTYAIDRSNLESIYVRNKIRNELIPILQKEYNPNLQDSLGRLAEVMQRDEDFFTIAVEQAWQNHLVFYSSSQVSLSRSMTEEHLAISSRLIRKAASIVTGEPRGLGYIYVQKIIDSLGMTEWSQDLPGLKVHISRDSISFYSSNFVEHKSCFEPFEKELRLNEWIKVPERNLEAGLLDETQFSQFWKESEENFDEQSIKVIEFNEEALKFSDNLVIRNRRAGDKMWFKGIGHKAIKKVFQEASVSSADREKIPVLALGHEVLWIVGIKRSEKFLPREKQKNYCVIRYLV